MKLHLLGASCLLALLSACSSGEEEQTKIPEIPSAKQIPITLNCVASTTSANEKANVGTRVTDWGYESQDKIGLYVVNYNGTTPGTLQNNGNHVNNMRFTYNGTWTLDNEIYWKDESTKADFYCYFPYGTPADVTSYAFSVKEDQSTETAYKACEFLYSKTSGVAPTAEAVNITTKHMFSCAVINVKAGNGFTDETLAQSAISVKMNGIKTGATINLTNGIATATGTAKTILPLENGNNRSYKALIVPQTASGSNFITVNIDGRDFNLKKEFTFVGGKRHTFSVTVSKTSNGINVGIGAWEDDDIDNGGVAE